MAFFGTTWYMSSVGYAAISVWTANTVIAAGTIRRQVSPTAANERAFIAVIGGTTHATTEPTWAVTRGALTTDNTVTWQEVTGQPSLNGDLTNTPNWTTVKNASVSLGQIIKRNNLASYQICTVAGTTGNGSEPSFSDTAGTSTTDSGVTWRSLGAVSNFTGGQCPFSRAKNALSSGGTWTNSGHTVYTKSDHAATEAADVILTGIASQDNPTRLICHDGGAYPPANSNLTTGASEASTGASQMNFLYTAGFGQYWRGFTFKMGSGANALNLMQPSAAGGHLTFEQCNLRIVATGGCNLLFNAQTSVRLIDSYFKFSHANDRILAQTTSCNIQMRGGGFESGTTVPSVFARMSAGGVMNFEGVDLSLLTTSKLFALGTACGGRVTFRRCKTNSGATLYDTATNAGGPMGPDVDFVLCDDGARNTQSARFNDEGADTTELTIVRTAGAQVGGVGVARKIVTTARSLFTNPFRGSDLVIPNTAIGSPITLTVYGIWGGGAVPTDEDLWIDVEYLGSSATPISSFVTSRRNFGSAAAGYSSDSSTWGGSTTKFKMSVTFTPQMAGPIIVHPCFATLSSTFYIDPRPELSIGPTIIRAGGLNVDGGFINEVRSARPLANAGM